MSKHSKLSALSGIVAHHRFVLLFRYIYLNVLEIEDNDLLLMFYSAEKYQLKDLSNQISKRLVSILDKECVMDMFEQTHHLNCCELQLGILNFVRERTEELFKSKSFESYSSEAIGLLLDQPMLSVSEINLLANCVRWARHQPSFRNQNGDIRNKFRNVLGENLFKFRFRSLLPEQISANEPFLNIFTCEVGKIMTKNFI